MSRLVRIALRPLTVVSVVAAALVALPASASTPSSGGTLSSPGANPTVVTQTVKCRVEGVGEDRVVTLYDIETERTMRIQLAEDVKIEARSKKQFGKKKLTFDHLAEGQEVKVTYRADTGEIKRLTVLPAKKA